MTKLASNFYENPSGKMNVDFINKNAKSSMAIVVFTNLEEGKSIKITQGDAKAKEERKIEIVD